MEKWGSAELRLLSKEGQIDNAISSLMKFHYTVIIGFSGWARWPTWISNPTCNRAASRDDVFNSSPHKARTSADGM